MTNGDFIRNMTDEELARLFAKARSNIDILSSYISTYKEEIVNKNLEWLQKEVVMNDNKN